MLFASFFHGNIFRDENLQDATFSIDDGRTIYRSTVY